MSGIPASDLDVVLRPLVSPETLARQWDLRVETVRHWCRIGRLPAVKLGGGTKPIWRIDAAEAERWLIKEMPRR